MRARGQDPSKIVPQLFTTYLGCEAEDTPFYRYIEHLENNYNDGTVYDTETLMFKAEEKYKELVERQAYKSGHDKPDDMVALQAQVAQLAEQLKKGNSGDGGGNKQGGKEGGKEKDRKQGAWIFRKPQPGEAKTKTINEKVYHWCEGHNGEHHKAKWVRHDPKDCGKRTTAGTGGNPGGNAGGTNEQARGAEGTPPQEGGGGERRVGWNAAMQATIRNQE